MTKLELVGEHWKDNLLGLTMTRELGLKIQEKYARELALIRAEMRLKELKEGKRRTRQNLNDVVTVSILDKKNRILDIGFNDPKDLMLDNMGKFLGDLLFNTPSGAARQGDFKDTTNASKTVQMYGPYNYGLFNGGGSNASSAGVKFQVGSGTTAAARANYAIQTAFGTAPENAMFSVGWASYAAGTGVMNLGGVVTAGGSGTVNETLLLYLMHQTDMSYTIANIAFCHDILGAGVAFTAGNIINVLYTFTF